MRRMTVLAILLAVAWKETNFQDDSNHRAGPGASPVDSGVEAAASWMKGRDPLTFDVSMLPTDDQGKRARGVTISGTMALLPDHLIQYDLNGSFRLWKEHGKPHVVAVRRDDKIVLLAPDKKWHLLTLRDFRPVARGLTQPSNDIEFRDVSKRLNEIVGDGPEGMTFVETAKAVTSLNDPRVLASAESVTRQKCHECVDVCPGDPAGDVGARLPKESCDALDASFDSFMKVFGGKGSHGVEGTMKFVVSQDRVSAIHVCTHSWYSDKASPGGAPEGPAVRGGVATAKLPDDAVSVVREFVYSNPRPSAGAIIPDEVTALLRDPGENR
jgi:hypothetical protein